QVVLNDSLGSIFTGVVTLQALKIKNIGFFYLLFQGTLDIDAIELHDLNGTLLKSEKLKKTREKDTTTHTEVDIDVSLSHLILKNTNVRIYDTEKDSLFLSLQNFNLDVRAIKIDNNTLAKSLPFVCEDYSIQSDSIFVKAGAHENLSIAQLSGNHFKTGMKNLHYRNKYSRTEYASILSAQRDHFDISIDTIVLQNTSLEAVEDQKLGIGIQKIDFKHPEIEIYRDKLVADAYSEKKFYSSILRESGLDISIDTFNITGARLVYTERTKEENTGGDIIFDDMDISMKNLGNTYMDDTIIDMNASFMNVSPFTSKWRFNVANTSDSFQFDGQLGFLDVQTLNQYTEPTMNVDLAGRIHKMYFAINGTNASSKMDLSVDYDHLAVSILNQKTKKKRKILSSVANILLSHKSKSASSELKTVQVNVERDRSKSFINFVVKNIKEGMTKVLL
ncbi:MAG TPA: hypothetical protein VKN36_00435, partial [Eudoraea sp.]|nr:hypothetical protein [Eudoraea sp.]